MKKGKKAQLQELLRADKLIVAPGAYDAFSARLVEQAGFPAVYISGAWAASSRLGVPDIGLATMSEVLDTAKNVVSATNIPVICDVDTGYGNALNLMRTVNEFERVGVAAIQIEDQIMSKKAGHIEGQKLITKEEMVKKIEAANYTRQSDDFVLIARTDAIGVNGFEDAIDRAKAYFKAGADVLFVEAPRSREEMKQITALLSDIPIMINIVEGGRTPVLNVKELESLGFRIAIFPCSACSAAVKAIQGVLKELKEKGSTDDFAENMLPLKEMFELVGLSHYRELEIKYVNF